MNITFIGGGNMASALISGLLQQGTLASSVRVVEISPEGRERLQTQYRVATFDSLSAAALAGEIVVLAVKPQQLREVAAQLQGMLTGKLVVSIAAGVRAADLARWLGGHPQLVRAMPNTPAMILSGITGLYALPEVSATQKQQAESVLKAVGAVVWLDSESGMDAITAVSGSGPAYVFYFMEALQDAARQFGFADPEARRLAVDTFLGAAKLAASSDEDLATLRARVTSKGGTTERAITTMEGDAVKAAIVRAVQGAAERSRELGDLLGKDA
ncbi:MAG: pyrroline-5-carboxylate reductase [Sulfuricella sp.]|nr:pyrroline-5-carboxylate reductase [Sulfuricella sp.]